MNGGQRVLGAQREYSAVTETVGPCYTGPDIAKWLGLSEAEIAERRNRHQVLGCRTVEGNWFYPIWQFLPDGSVVPGLSHVARVLFRGTDDPWRVARWIASEHSDLPDG